MDISKRIIALREGKGWSQRELAKRIEINVSVMNRIESGERPIKDHELAKISDVLDVPSDYLLGRTDSKVFHKSDNNLTKKDEIDIAKRMEKMKQDLIEGNANGEGLNFMGEPMSEEAIESLLEALEHAERIATLTNKKFTPKKYRDKE